ncbi:Benzoate 1,2-dioxygenase electron transfer component [Nonomuraea coxensis DSM 45129]|uniref:Benzoate 1,2-dioxygenase electron transfer component n=1 Tax=Nonomuraea coxensis DSM 45129 TaxID=1122611 RepID=A0ABX8UIE4_9ACTN|nr:ferredoxin reductase [Nonomuraea coxensis]QYC45912.1 Benzoate 1,2-dioxygenase electron transfer component [Nonomuraea coxensis DSM 45129]
MRGRLPWRAARLREVRVETATARTLVFEVPGWPGHLAGQHVDVRLTAGDGYTAQRSYSLAAPPDGELVALTVETVPDGEVSPYLTEVMEPGDLVEIRGPVGGWFVWRPASRAPVLLVGGGSGIVPLMAMIRERRRVGSRAPFRLVYSLRDPESRYYAEELRRPDPGLDVTYLYTRAAPDGVSRPAGRVTLADLAEGGWPTGFEADCYVCGPTGFVEAAADLLLALGHAPERVRTERFGPTGG